MKKILLPLCMLALFVSCTNDNEPGTGNAPVPIQVGGSIGMEATVTKAAINPDASGTTTFTAGIAGWEAEQNAADYTNNPTWGTTVSLKAYTSTATGKTNGTWDEAQYYPQNENTYTHMKAWHPAGALSGTTVTFENTDGSVDAMLAEIVLGNKDHEGTPHELNFSHMTTQIKFEAKVDANLPTGTSFNVTSLQLVKDAGNGVTVDVPTDFDLTKGPDEDGAVTFTSKDAITMTTNTTISSTTDATSIDGGFLIKPCDKIAVKAEASGVTYDAVVVDAPAGGFVAGTAYTVTLTFSGAQILVTATVDEWTNATTNPGDVTII